MSAAQRSGSQQAQLAARARIQKRRQRKKQQEEEEQDLQRLQESWAGAKKQPRKQTPPKKPASDFKLTVLTMDGQETSICIRSDDLVVTLKQLFERETGIPVGSQELLLPDRQEPLDNEGTLQSSGVADGDFLFCANHECGLLEFVRSLQSHLYLF